MATVNLGSIRFNWKGAYNNSTAYVVNDVVTSSGNSYVCIQASQGNAVGNATAYWNIMSSAGTNGTDLTSTLTTRGDIVYKGASALTRLPKGTAGYYLKQGANDPEWAELSGGDYVKLATVSVSSNVATVAVDGNGSWADNSVYGSYFFVLQNISTTNDSSSANVYFRINTTGSQNQNSQYYSTAMGSDANSSASGHNAARTWGATEFGLSFNNMDSEAERSGYGTIELLNTGGNNVGGSGSYYPTIQSNYFSHHSFEINVIPNFLPATLSLL